MEPSRPRDGDVLVSHPVARIECEIAIVPRLPHAVHARQDVALASAAVLAESLGVDAWFTHDARYFKRIASFRPAQDDVAVRPDPTPDEPQGESSIA